MILEKYISLYEAPEKILYSLENPNQIESILSKGLRDSYFSDDLKTLRNRSLRIKSENGKIAVLKVQLPKSSLIGNNKTAEGYYIKKDKLNRAIILDVKYKNIDNLQI